MPIGSVYFTIAATGLSVAVGLMVSPFLHLFTDIESGIRIVGDNGGELYWSAPGWSLPLFFLAGVLLFFVMLHIARGIGYLHGQLAKHLLVKLG
jgi:hypothetical protein